LNTLGFKLQPPAWKFSTTSGAAYFILGCL
jgi:hypothetical protein